MTSLSDELKKCPFCHSSQISVELRIPVWGDYLPEKTVICNDCAASAPYYIWNMRHVPDTGTGKRRSSRSHTQSSTLHLIN